MSVTTTDNAAIAQLQRNTLEAYTEQPPEETSSPAPDPNAHPQDISPTNPSDWQTEWRRVPAYRPVNQGLDMAQRDTYQNNIERSFVWVMLRGVNLMATSAQTWRMTGGRLNDTFFRYKIGGEW